jgi:hypothetical protein
VAARRLAQLPHLQHGAGGVPRRRVERTYVGAKISTDMLEDAETEIPCGLKGSYDFCSTLPDLYTKVLARQLMKQLRENWRSTRVISSGYHATSRADRRAATNAKG